MFTVLMKLNLILSIWVVLIVSIVQTVSADELKTYKEWKLGQIQAAQAQLKTHKSKLGANMLNQRSKTESVAIAGGTQQLEMQLQTDLLLLETAKDLTLTDYFVGYLSQFPNSKMRLKQLASRMSKDEIAELMLSYANSVLDQQDSRSNSLNRQPIGTNAGNSGLRVDK